MNSRLRNELKFVINHHQKNELLRAFSSSLESDPHYDACGTEINSLYFESPRHTAFHEKADGLANRWKARARSYYSLLNHNVSLSANYAFLAILVSHCIVLLKDVLKYVDSI